MMKRNADPKTPCRKTTWSQTTYQMKNGMTCSYSDVAVMGPAENMAKNTLPGAICRRAAREFRRVFHILVADRGLTPWDLSGEAVPQGQAVERLAWTVLVRKVLAGRGKIT